MKNLTSMSYKHYLSNKYICNITHILMSLVNLNDSILIINNLF